MSQFAIFSGPALCDQPEIYSFSEFAGRLKSSTQQRAEDRARLEFRNRTCPHCDRTTVDPIELRDGQFGRNGAMIPGTGTLVGFGCHACGHEWPV
ncbi:hypothetical protein AB1L42_05945 [Thalassoglobus sp. JC818]|uniref:hypothetical protein n=1 Tax=Thalassoglobus sp. JC818 TaxID=3232136 RepID=UPI003459C1ED